MTRLRMLQRYPLITLAALACTLSAFAEEETAPRFEGYTLFAPLRSTETYLINMDGEVVHTWKADSPPGHAVYLLENGHLLRCARVEDTGPFHGGGIGGRIEEYDWDSNLLWQYTYANDDHCQHHDIEPLPNGNVLILAWERISENDAYRAGRNPETLSEAGLWADHIVEVKPLGKHGGLVVWEWHALDHLIQDLDPEQLHYGIVREHPELIDFNAQGQTKAETPDEVRRLRGLGYIGGPPGRAGRGGDGNPDWNHTNSIDYNPELDQILLSVLNANEIWIIDHSTTTEEASSHAGGRSGKGGDLLFRWGNPAAHDAGSRDDQQLFAQHDAQWIEPGLPGAGNILIFNNGRGRRDGAYSSVVELKPPVRADGIYLLNQDSVRLKPTWVYTARERETFFSSHISGAQRLPNGHTLICSGESGLLFQVTHDGTTVWEYKNTHGGNAGPRNGPRIGPRNGLRNGLRNGPGNGPGNGPPRGPRRPHRAAGDGGPGARGPQDSATALFRATRYAPDYPGLAALSAE